MIVKDEAPILARCIKSVLPFIDAWAVADTGSSDGTPDIVRDLLAGRPGRLIERPWRDFSTNRNEALELARGFADYILVIDADEALVPDKGFAMPRLVADAYRTVNRGDSDFVFKRTQFVRSDLPWRYTGVLHEALVCDGPHRIEQLAGLTCRAYFDSARNRQDPVEKYRKDAVVLKRALTEDPNNARTMFYLAQSYRDAGDSDRAIAAYGARADMGGWGEEVWYSFYQAGLLLLAKGENAQGIETLLRAYNERPTRAEPLHALAAHHRVRQEWHLAYLFAAGAAAIPQPPDILFLSEPVYSWRSCDELSIAAYYVGRYRESHDLTRRLLESAALPADQKSRIESNLRFAADKLAAGTNS